MYQPIDNEIFHVHTKRCKHASMDEDFQYVEAAIHLGADRIVFTDHAPFPGDPFRNRMEMKDLPDYMDSMKGLKKEYGGKIEVLCGLEIEYLPSFGAYYRELYDSKEFDLLMLSQHFYENEDGSFSFMNEEKSEEFKGLRTATVQGIETGLFDVVAHPDRIFRRCNYWNAELMGASYDIINAALKHPIFLEKNFSSQIRKNQFWPPFWVRAARNLILEGYDVHSVKEMEKFWERKHATLNQAELSDETFVYLMRDITGEVGECVIK